MELVRCILQQSIKLEKELKPDNTLKLHRRVKKELNEYMMSHPQKLIEVNEIKILKYTEFEGFINGLIKKLDTLGYFKTFENLQKGLQKAKGLFPLKILNTFDKKDLYLEFIFKNQRGIHADDLDMIFKILEIESYNNSALVRGFTMLFTENQSKFN